MNTRTGRVRRIRRMTTSDDEDDFEIVIEDGLM